MSKPRIAKFLRGLFLLGLLLFATFYILCLLTLAGCRVLDPPWTSVQVQRHLEALVRGQEPRRRYSFVPLEQISVHLQHAVIAAEDGRFYQHGGIDWEELKNALESNWRRGSLWRGGSTLTQQLVKNLFLSTHSSLLRKGVEFTLAPAAELVLDKERILELYLNIVEWGPGIYGAEEAARHHYGIPASRLNREQAARLAACLPAPRTRTPQQMDRYGAEILRRMAQMGW